jgi:hypothetical protein
VIHQEKGKRQTRHTQPLHTRDTPNNLIFRNGRWLRVAAWGTSTNRVTFRMARHLQFCLIISRQWSEPTVSFSVHKSESTCCLKFVCCCTSELELGSGKYISYDSNDFVDLPRVAGTSRSLNGLLSWHTSSSLLRSLSASPPSPPFLYTHPRPPRPPPPQPTPLKTTLPGPLSREIVAIFVPGRKSNIFFNADGQVLRLDETVFGPEIVDDKDAPIEGLVFFWA